MKNDLLLRLFIYLVPLSFMTIGGGQSIVTDLQRQIVDVFGWMSNDELAGLFAFTRMTPGPSTTIVSLIGWKVAGLAGVLVATFAIYAPASIAIYGLATVWARYDGAMWQRAVTEGLSPVAAAMILATCVILLRTAVDGPLGFSLAIVSALLIFRWHVNPLLLIASGATASWVLG